MEHKKLERAVGKGTSRGGCGVCRGDRCLGFGTNLMERQQQVPDLDAGGNELGP